VSAIERSFDDQHLLRAIKGIVSNNTLLIIIEAAKGYKYYLYPFRHHRDDRQLCQGVTTMITPIMHSRANLHDDVGHRSYAGPDAIG
jgi:hypothetical protein